MLTKRVVEACTPWVVDHTERLYELTIKEGARIIAPEGKFLTLTVDGCGREIKPGAYKGDIVMAVTDYYEMPAHGLKLNFAEMFAEIRGEELDPEALKTPVKAAAVIHDNKVVAGQTNPAILQNGVVGDRETDGVYIASTEEDLCGIVVEGDSKYTIKNSRFDMEGNGHDDWLGKGTAISVGDSAELLVDNCQFHFAGVTRCTLQAGMNSRVTVKNSRFINMAPDGTDWVGDFSWQCGLRGHNRLTQLSDNADVLYENCFMHSNGWGLCSIDGTGDPKPRSDDPAEWPEQVSRAMEDTIAPSLTISTQTDTLSREVSVQADYIPAPEYRITYWIVEDSIQGAQAMPDGSVNLEYYHRHVLRFSSDEPVIPIPTECDITRCAIIALLIDNNDNHILNAYEKKLVNTGN